MNRIKYAGNMERFKNREFFRKMLKKHDFSWMILGTGNAQIKGDNSPHFINLVGQSRFKNRRICKNA